MCGLPLRGAPLCEAAARLAIPNVTVISAASIAAGPFTPQDSGRARAIDVPGFCRIRAVANPVPDSSIGFELWLPATDAWNRRFLGTGNGGYSSTLSYPEMIAALKKGYAVAGSDTGHEGDDLKFAIGHPGKIEDWGYRAVHVMTEVSKLIIRHYYARFPDYSYFAGCSTGGQQALSEAQRFPADYDGIIAGDPGNNRIRLNAGFLWSWLALNQNSGASLPVSKLAVIHKAVVSACDALDGVKDGLIADPRRCKFDPETLVCKEGDQGTCLTPPQVEAVRRVYEGARNPRTGEQIFAGSARGSEANGTAQVGGWSGYFAGKEEPARLDFWRYWVFHDPGWDLHTFDFDRDVTYAESELPAVVANSPNLSAYKQRNGKLIMYHGWADPVVPPEDGIRYYESVESAMGGHDRTADFLRLFMAPGMGHCGGGEGPNTFDTLAALDGWVTNGAAPAKIIASHSSKGVIDRTRALCPYPQVAKWDGKGSIDDAASFACSAP